ncbi:hypothetical protein AOLI_G00301420 [Acnodon oligacanthus]
MHNISPLSAWNTRVHSSAAERKVRGTPNNMRGAKRRTTEPRKGDPPSKYFAVGEDGKWKECYWKHHPGKSCVQF